MSTRSQADLREALHVINSAEADQQVVFTVPYATAGVLVRRHARAAFNSARASGARVDVREDKGLFDSAFSGRLVGTPDQLRPCVAMLLRLGEDG